MGQQGSAAKPTDERPPIVDAVVVYGELVHTGERGNTLAGERLHEVEPVRGEVDHGTAAGAGAVDAPVVGGWGTTGGRVRTPVVGQPAGVVEAHLREYADAPLGDQLGDAPMCRVVSLVEGRGVRRARPLGGLGDSLGLACGRRHRFFQQDAYARLQARDGLLGVEVVGRRDIHAVEFGLGEHVA